MILINLKNSTKPQNQVKKEKKALTFENTIRLNGFESKMFLIGKETYGNGRPGMSAHVSKVSDGSRPLD